MKIIAIYSNKGGVGKTATAVNLSYAFSRLGKRTLLCDLDFQGACGYYFRVHPKKKFNRKKLLSGDISRFIRGTDFDNLDLLPSHLSFRNIDLALQRSTVGKKTSVLKKSFATLEDEYDILVLDCPPNLTLLSENIFKVADIVVIPVVPTTLSILALKQLIMVFDKLNLSKKKIAPFFSMVEKRKRLHRDTMRTYKKYSIFLKTSVPFMTHVERMGVNRCPVAVSHPRSEIELIYRKLQWNVWKRSRKI